MRRSKAAALKQHLSLMQQRCVRAMAPRAASIRKLVLHHPACPGTGPRALRRHRSAVAGRSARPLLRSLPPSAATPHRPSGFSTSMVWLPATGGAFPRSGAGLKTAWACLRPSIYRTGPPVGASLILMPLTMPWHRSHQTRSARTARSQALAAGCPCQGGGADHGAPA